MSESLVKYELTTLTSNRFLAALLVFLFHIHIRWPLSGPTLLINTISQGAVGMSLFFVLSGFILTYNYYDPEKPVLNDYYSFMVKRFARIYPVYVVSGLSFIAIDMFNVTPPHEIIKSFFLIGTNLLLIQGWFPSLFNYWNDGGTWSLSVEFFCYLLFPILLFKLSQYKKKILCIILAGLVILTILPGVATLFDSSPSSVTIAYSLPMFRLPEFIVGMITCLFFINLNKPVLFVQTKLFIICLIGLTWLGVLGNKLPAYIGHNVIIIPTCAAFIYMTAALKTGWLLKLFKHPYFKFLGEASYSFYLLQGIPIFITKAHYKTLVETAPILSNHWILTGFILIPAVTLSALSYLFIEQPCRKKIMNFYFNRKMNKIKEEMLLEKL